MLPAGDAHHRPAHSALDGGYDNDGNAITASLEDGARLPMIIAGRCAACVGYLGKSSQQLMEQKDEREQIVQILIISIYVIPACRLQTT